MTFLNNESQISSYRGLELPPPIPKHIVEEIESESPFVPRINIYFMIIVGMFLINFVGIVGIVLILLKN